MQSFLRYYPILTVQRLKSWYNYNHAKQWCEAKTKGKKMNNTATNEVTIQTTKRTSHVYDRGSFVDAITLNGVEIGQLYRRSVNDIFPTVFIGEKKFEIDTELVELHFGKPEINVVINYTKQKSTQLNKAYTAKTDWLWINGTPSVATIKALAIRIAEEQIK